MSGIPNPLLPAAKNVFRGETEPEATTIFFSGEGGKAALTSMGDDTVSYAERVSPVWPYTRVALLVLCALSMLSSLAFALVWMVRELCGKMKDWRPPSVVGFPL